MDVTTVKVHKKTKIELSKLKKKSESYDEVIAKLVSQAKNKGLKSDLIAGYKQMDASDLQLLEEWEAASEW